MEWTQNDPTFFDNFQYYFELWSKGKVARFTRLEELPEEAERLKETFRRLTVKSVLSVPVSVSGRVVGGLLVQGFDRMQYETLKVVTQREPSEKEKTDLLFAWVICKHVKSNAIVYAKDGTVVGVGAGQMSRVDASMIAARKAGERARGSVLASDAFFPFRDGVDAAAEAGVTAVIQPGGSMRDDEAIKAADEHGMAMLFTGMRHFKH